MATNGKLQRSIAAHKRLMKKYDSLRLSLKGHDRDVACVKCFYHDRIAYTQAKIGKVLSRKERERAYEHVESEILRM